MTGKVFGRPLAELLKEDKKKHPNLRVPYFCDQAVRHIVWNGFDSEGIFRLSGNQDRVNEMREAIDRGEEIDFIQAKSAQNDVCSLFKMYLRKLPEPLLISEKYEQWLNVTEAPSNEERKQALQQLIASLPEPNRDLLSLMIPLMAKLAMNSHVHKMDTANLSKVLAPNLLWKEGNTSDPASILIEANRLNDVIEGLIANYEDYFQDILDENGQWAHLYAKLFGHKKSILCVACGYQNKHMWSCDSTGSIRIWDVATSKVVKEIDSEQGRIFSMTRVSEKHMWTASQKSAKVWDLETWECVKEFEGFTYCMARVGDTIWVGGEGKITVYTPELTVFKEIPIDRGNVILTMGIDAYGARVWTGATDKCIRVWDIETCTLVKVIKKGKVNAFAACGDQIWSGDDSSLCVWNAKTFELIKQLEGHNGAVYDFQYCGDYMWSASWDTSIRVWDTRTLDCVCVFRNYHSDAVSQIKTIWNDAKKCWQAWTGSWDKSIVVWILGSNNGLPEGPILGNSNNYTRPISEEEEIERVTANLEVRTNGLAQRRESLQERKRNLTLRKQQLEEKKAALAKRKQELATESNELLSQP